MGIPCSNPVAFVFAPSVLQGSACSGLQLAFHGAGRSWGEDLRRREVNAERWDGVGESSSERKPPLEIEIG